jgi:flagellar assembly protein FliH
VILQAIAQATDALPLHSAQLLIKLHPDDVALVQQSYGEDELSKRQWQLRAEPLVERGGCLVESALSSVDRSLSQRVQSSLEHFIQLQQHSSDRAAETDEG